MLVVGHLWPTAHNLSGEPLREQQESVLRGLGRGHGVGAFSFGSVWPITGRPCAALFFELGA